MIVFIAGMPRSGSTFAFNVARDALHARGSVYQANSANVLEQLAHAGNANHILVKDHILDEPSLRLAQYGGMRVVCTVRRPEDAVASWMHLLGVSERDAISIMRDWLRLYRKLRPFSLTVSYRTIDRQSFVAARRITRFLFNDAGISEAFRISRRHSKALVKRQTDDLSRDAQNVKDLGITWYDKNTFFHRRHVSSLRSQSAEERLSADQILRIRAALADEVAAAGL